MRLPLLLTAALTATLLAACGSTSTPGSGASASDQPSTLPTVEPSGSPTGPLPSSPPTVPPPADSAVPADLADRPEVKAAMQDAAGRAGIVASDVQIGGYMAVTWADGSLGCPQKGMAYTQMTVEGELLLLRVDQRVLEYHARQGAPFSYCANPSGTYSPRTAG
ncbi:hypothetical protein [Arthrobacter sp. NEB 688]|uniref:hypothetical protein n=1 Tax=Arthrobacter sp. NEB 688 TaxID=904039 RepID=UPI001564A003|nr:hypothetical protein [Arthrobacter sp. NEB 688]QKE82604.1 hypothetical protein HL663_00620 [Arthrobacter sp. NEB 688]